MNSAKTFALALVLTAMPTAWAADQPQSEAKAADGNACTWISSIDDWRRLDDRNLVVWVSRNEVYQVELTMPLHDLVSASSIGFVDHNRDGRLCGFGMDQIIVPHAPVFGSSTIANMSRLDPAGLKALEAQYNVKLTPKQKKVTKAVAESGPKQEE